MNLRDLFERIGDIEFECPCGYGKEANYRMAIENGRLHADIKLLRQQLDDEYDRFLKVGHEIVAANLKIAELEFKLKEVKDRNVWLEDVVRQHYTSIYPK